MLCNACTTKFTLSFKRTMYSVYTTVLTLEKYSFCKSDCACLKQVLYVYLYCNEFVQGTTLIQKLQEECYLVCYNCKLLYGVAVVQLVKQSSMNLRVSCLTPGFSCLHVEVSLDKTPKPCSSIVRQLFTSNFSKGINKVVIIIIIIIFITD